MGILKSESFHSKYGFKTACRSKRIIKYEGITSNCPKDLLAELKRVPENKKFILVYESE